MKTFIFLLLSFVFADLSAQNTISFVFQPTDLGLGIRYDRQINPINDLYFSISYGNYKLGNESSVKDHIKISSGLTFKINETSYLSIAPSYHFYGKQTEIFTPLPEAVIFPYSIDFGCGVYLNKFRIGFCFDFFKWESSINLGIWF